jgi:tetratricopeptide (TPR) repeat protein
VVEAAGEVFGDAPNVAARVQAAAEPGSVLITMNVQRQVAGLLVVEEQGARELKGMSEPVQLFRVVRASGGGRRGRPRALTPFVGRDDELALLSRRWRRARKGEGQFTLVVGEPGIGKSRLVEEFRARLGETPHTFVEWTSSQLLRNTPLHPIAEWGRLRFGDADVPAEKRLADLENMLKQIDLDAAEYAPLLAPIVDIPLPEGRALSLPPEELRRRQMAAIVAWALAGARSQPIAIAFEDLHWADPTSLDLMRALAERGAQAPLFIVATARPEFRPPWGMRSHHSVIALEPLGRAEVARMVGEIALRHAVSKEVIEGVSERTGGVPLFVEEVTRLLLERTERGGAQAIPATLQQSLAARLDRLGPAREIAQIGAVLGRDFSYGLLASVAAVADRGPTGAVAERDLSGHAAAADDRELQSALDRLIEADMLIVEGVGRQSTYRFKHALIKDAAYESLLKSRRQALHRRAAEALCDAKAEPEEIAHHFTEAGLDDLAIEWWGKAGDQALRRSAFQEAIAHLGKAIAMADKPARAESQGPAGHTGAASQRLKLQSDYAMAVAWSRGWADHETAPAFARALSLSQPDAHSRSDFVAQHGHCIGSVMRGDIRLAREAAEAFLREAERERRPTETGVALRALGFVCIGMGDFKMASVHLERAVDEYDPERDREVRFPFGQDTKAAAAAFLCCPYWAIGRLEEARALSDRANAWAGELAHDPSLANAWLLTAFLEILRGDAGAALQAADRGVEVSRRRDLPFYLLWSQIVACYARGRLYDPEAGAKELREALTPYLERGNKYFAPWIYGMMADLEAMTGRVDNGLASAKAGLALAKETGDRWTDALLHRLRGDILLKRDSAKPALAEEAFKTAIVIAKQQGARSHELLAALSLANLYQSTGRPADAHAVLAPALEGFSPTPEMPEIVEAQALMERLS